MDEKQRDAVLWAANWVANDMLAKMMRTGYPARGAQLYLAELNGTMPADTMERLLSVAENELISRTEGLEIA